MTSSDVAVAAMQTLARYALAVDTGDIEALVALLTDDVRLTRPGEEVEGIDAFVEAYRPFLEADRLGTRHLVTNMIVDETGPGAVTVWSRFEALVFTETETRRIVGSYQDDLVLVGDSWLFEAKRNFLDWELQLPPVTVL